VLFHYFLPQRLAAALAAIWERFFGPSAAALAAPPFNPPRRPSATAAGFFGLITGGALTGASPMDSRKIRCASSLGSRGLVFERSGIPPAWAIAVPMSRGSNFKLTHYQLPWRRPAGGQEKGLNRESGAAGPGRPPRPRTSAWSPVASGNTSRIANSRKAAP
jgi:hypothetical protein